MGKSHVFRYVICPYPKRGSMILQNLYHQGQFHVDLRIHIRVDRKKSKLCLHISDIRIFTLRQPYINFGAARARVHLNSYLKYMHACVDMCRKAYTSICLYISVGTRYVHMCWYTMIYCCSIQSAPADKKEKRKYARTRVCSSVCVLSSLKYIYSQVDHLHLWVAFHSSS